MIRDEIMAMAQEAGLGQLLPAVGNLPAQWYGSDIKALEKFSALAEASAMARFSQGAKIKIPTANMEQEFAAHERRGYARGVADERKRCQTVCEEVKDKSNNHLFRSGAAICAGEVGKGGDQ